MSKEIVRFHTIIWPAILMALELPVPKAVFSHGWWLADGEKMSKSKGNVVDPIGLIESYGADAVRYYMLREFAFGQDANFTRESLVNRINADLANDLGNLLSRTVGMVEKYFGGELPDVSCKSEYDADLTRQAEGTVSEVERKMDALMFSEALSETWKLVRRANKYIDENQPWLLAKDPEKKAALANVLYHLAETLRILAVLIAPVMPNTPRIIREQLNISGDEFGLWDSAKNFGMLPRAVKVTKGPAAFPRIEK